MALTPLQRRILRVIAKNRSPESHIAGGAPLASDLLLGAGSLGDRRRSRPRPDRRRIRGARVKFQYPSSRCCS